MHLKPSLIKFFALLSAVAGLSGCQEKAKQGPPPPPTVEVVEVAVRDVPIIFEWVATTDGMVNAAINAQVSGYLMSQAFQEGRVVRKGQLLFQIDPRPFQATLDQAQGNLRRAEGAVEQARSSVAQAQGNLAQAQARRGKTELDVKRYTPLAKVSAISQQELDDAVQADLEAKADIESCQAAVAAAQANVIASIASVDAAKAQVETARLSLGFCSVTSPIDGIVGLATAQVGDLVGPTSGDLTTVSTVDPIKVYITLSEQEYLNSRRHGANTNIPLSLVLADGSVFPSQGKFIAADRQVDVRTGSLRVASEFPNPGNILRPGQFGRVRAVLGTQQGALLVPQRAVTEMQGNYLVAVVGADRKVSIRPVKMGNRVDQDWIVLEGVKAGEKVIAEGVAKVKDGMEVNPTPYKGTGKQQ